MAVERVARGEARQALLACKGAFGAVFLFSFFVNLLMLTAVLEQADLPLTKEKIDTIKRKITRR